MDWAHCLAFGRKEVQIFGTNSNDTKQTDKKVKPLYEDHYHNVSNLSYMKWDSSVRKEHAFCCKF